MELTTQHLIALLPLLVTCATIVVVMLAIAWRRHHSQTFVLSVVGLNLALLSIIPALKVAPLTTGFKQTHAVKNIPTALLFGKTRKSNCDRPEPTIGRYRPTKGRLAANHCGSIAAWRPLDAGRPGTVSSCSAARNRRDPCRRSDRKALPAAL